MNLHILFLFLKNFVGNFSCQKLVHKFKCQKIRLLFFPHLFIFSRVFNFGYICPSLRFLKIFIMNVQPTNKTHIIIRALARPTVLSDAVGQSPWESL
jgi:hypothetical protein